MEFEEITAEKLSYCMKFAKPISKELYGNAFCFDFEKASEILRDYKAQILKEELDKNGLSKEHYEKLAQYIKGNVVPQQIREAITDMLANPIPNIMHLCAQEAGWIKKED